MTCVLTILLALVAPSIAHAQTESRARLAIEPAHAEIGKPVVWTLVVETAASAKVTLPDLKDLPREWALIEPLGVRRTDDPSNAARRITTASWRVMALDAGDVSAPALKVDVEENGTKKSIEAGVAKIDVAHALDADEDAPRPAKGWRPAPDVGALSPRGVVTALGLILLAIAAWFLRKRLWRKPVVAPAKTPLERLAALEERARLEPEAAREIVYSLTRSMREAVDAFVSEPRGSLTDAAWSASFESDERVPSGVRAATARILANAERVKYAQESPSRFALDETLKDARSALEALAAAPPPAPVANETKEAA
jgi:hypothetical protein